MFWIHLVTALALLQFLFFSILVGLARGRYGVPAPALTGHEAFERLVRVQGNTLELLAAFLPALWLAALYWEPKWVALAGAVYLVGRVVYFRSYTRAPETRAFGFRMSLVPILGLLIAVLVGLCKSWSA